MTSLRYVALVGLLGGTIGAAHFGPLQAAQGAADVLKKAGVPERLVDRTLPHVPRTGTAPSFVVDPGWPKPLPNNWIFGEVSSIAVDAQDLAHCDSYLLHWLRCRYTHGVLRACHKSEQANQQ